MRFYEKQHKFYCGVDLHTRMMYVCIHNQAGQVQVHQNIRANPEAFLKLIKPYRDDLVVAVECMFAWYWLADLCERERIHFVLGHALYMKAISGGKAKNDKIDSMKIAKLLRGGNIPEAYAYPKAKRSTRDLLRRRMYLVHKRAELLGHIQNTNSQYNLPPFGKKLDRPSNRKELKVAERFTDPGVRKNVELDLAALDHYDELIRDVELYLVRHARVDDPQTYARLKTIPGVGKVLALVLMYEIHDINRFANQGRFISYCRLVRPRKESDGKPAGKGGAKIGNAHLKWAFSEATCLFMKSSDRAKKFVARKEKNVGKGKAMSALAAKLGRTVYWMLKRDEAFDINRFFAN